MDLDPDTLEGKTTREILRVLVEYVVRSDEQMEEKETRSGDLTDLNIYVCDNESYEIGALDQWIALLADSDHVSGHTTNYVAEHTFGERVVNDRISLVTITTPAKGREDDFVFVTNDGYLWVLTTVHSDWRKQTIENLLKYLPCVERLYLSSEDLEYLTDRVEDSRISGFTAKYHAPNRERDATLTFSGAESGDLQKAEETFDAKPTRIEFDQSNSPITAIQGASTNKGRLTVRSVRHGAESKAVETFLGLSEEYQELDQQNFDVEHRPEHESLETGFAVDGFTAVELTDPDRNEAEDLVAELEEEVLNGDKYRYGIRDGGRKVRVFDAEYGEIFDVAIEEPDIVLYARGTTTALSLRSFVREVYDELDSTYTLSKATNPVATR